MFTLKDMPATASSMFSAYANFAAFSMMIRSMATELIPDPIRSYIYSLLHSLFASSHHHHHLTLVVDEHSGNMARNQVFDSAEVYLRAHISPAADRLHVSKAPRQKSISLSIDKGQEISDTFGNINLKWSYVCTENKNGNYTETRRYFELTFLKKHKAQVVDSYLPYVIDRANAIKEEAKVVKLYTTNSVYNNSYDDDSHGNWNSINLEHPSTFETIAMDPDQKKMIMEDLDRFLRRREFYKKVGKAWKRGYLLYGPPGTGKSSLIAAMANYLKFDVYDLELASIYNDSALRSTLLSTTNRSILVIEDIDCSVEMKNREGIHESQPSNKLTLSGLLNFIDGLWSSCGDERIIVFTTNHKDRLDPALLRPGRMDMHIHMSYCTPNGFMILASNYLGIHDSNPHNLCGEIEGLIESTEVTPAEVAEELMKSDDVDVALQGLASFLKRRQVESSNKIKDEEVINQTDEIQEVDRETENGEQC